MHLAEISRLYSSQLLAGGLGSGDSNGRLVRHKSREHYYLHDLELAECGWATGKA